MTLSRIMHNIVAAMTGRLATAALNYGLFWYLAKTVDAITLGGFSLLMSVFAMVSLMPLLGLSIPIMRRIAISAEALPVEVSNAFAFALPVSVVLGLCIGAWGQVSHHADLVIPYWLVALTLLPSAWVLIAEGTLLARDRMRVVTRVNLLEALVRTVLSVLAVQQGQGLAAIFVVVLAARCLSAIVYLYHPLIPLPKASLWSRALQRRNCSEVPVFLGITIVAALVLRLDVVVLSHLQGLRDAAVYSAASRLYEAAQMLPTITALVLMPVLARKHANAPETIPATLALIVRMLVIFGLGPAVFASAFAPQVIAILYPPQMADAAGVLRLLMFGAVILMVDVVLSSTMLATKAQGSDLRALVVGLAVLALGLLVLVPAQGMIGAAAAVVVGIGTRIALRLHWAVRKFELPSPWLYLCGAVVACVAAVIATLAMRDRGPLVAGVLGLLVYAGTCVLTGAVDRPFVHQVRAALGALSTRRLAR